MRLLTCSRDILPWLHVLMASDCHAKDPGVVIMNKSESGFDIVLGWHGVSSTDELNNSYESMPRWEEGILNK